MKPQLEPVRQERLKHLVQLVDIGGALRLGADIEPLGVHPVRAADKLAVGDLVHQLDNQPQRHTLRDIGLATRQRTDPTAPRRGIGGLDGGDFERQRRLLFGLRSACDCAADRRDSGSDQHDLCAQIQGHCVLPFQYA